MDKALADKAKLEFPSRLQNTLAAPVISKDTSVRHSKSEKARVIYEFCGANDSELGKVSQTTIT